MAIIDIKTLSIKQYCELKAIPREFEKIIRQNKACYDYLKSKNTCPELIESLKDNASLKSVQRLVNYMNLNNFDYSTGE